MLTSAAATRFFKNMCPLTPIITDWYSDLRNMRAFVEEEPVLCSVILTLSSRYHLLHGDGWLSRSYFLHNRLWRYCHSLLQRVIWGQEKCIVSVTRSLGTVEGLLLMAEWHARSLHLPPDTEAWDSDDDKPQNTQTNSSNKCRHCLPFSRRNHPSSHQFQFRVDGLKELWNR